MFGLFVGYLAVSMQPVDAQIPAVRQAKDVGTHLRQIFCENAKIMHSARAKSRCDDFQRTLVDDYLCFLRMPLLLSTVILSLLFFGRSIGCSVTSINTTSITVSLDLSAFLPGK